MGIFKAFWAKRRYNKRKKYLIHAVWIGEKQCASLTLEGKRCSRDARNVMEKEGELVAVCNIHGRIALKKGWKPAERG